MSTEERYLAVLRAMGSHALYVFTPMANCIMQYRLIKTERRLTFDIQYQHPDTRYMGDDDGPYYTFKASNGYEVISRSRMDIQTERLWLLGASEETRSGTMIFSTNEKRDAAYDAFVLALDEWAQSWDGRINVE